VGKGRNMLPGDNKQVGRCHRINVAKGNHPFILIKDIGGYFTGYNFAENAIHFSVLINLPLVLFIYLTPLIPLSFKGEGEVLSGKGLRPFPLPYVGVLQRQVGKMVSYCRLHRQA